MVTFKKLNETQSEILYLGMLTGILERPFRGGYLVHLFGRTYEFTEAERPKVKEFIRSTIAWERYRIQSEENLLAKGYKFKY